MGSTAMSEHHERNRRLYEAMRAGDGAARAELILANEGIALAAATPFVRAGRLAADDAAQAARLGLIRAVDSWDADGSTLATWAALHCRRELAIASHQRSPVAIPAKYRGYSLATLRRMGAAAVVAAIEAEVLPLGDPPAPIEYEPSGHLESWVARHVKRLPGRQRHTVRHAFGLGAPKLTQAEIARESGVRPETVRDGLRGGLERLRVQMGGPKSRKHVAGLLMMGGAA